jgi:hypothetical protein
MSTATTTTTTDVPLFPGGPSIDQLTAKRSPWRIAPEQVDAYLALCEDRAAYGQAVAHYETQRAAGTGLVGVGLVDQLRRRARMLAGLPVDTNGMVEQTWPAGVGAQAFAVHYEFHTLADRAVRYAANRAATAAEYESTHRCESCRQVRPSVQPRRVESMPGVTTATCDPCWPVVERALVDAYAAQKLGKNKTRAEAAADLAGRLLRDTTS